MATNYTTRSTGTPLPEKDRRAIAVSRKVQIGGKDGTIVSDDKVVTKEVVTKELYIDDDNETSVNILDLIKGASSGIDIIGSDQTFTGATKIQFQGDNVYISKKDDGTIVIRIGKVTINPLQSVTEDVELTLAQKYVFGPSSSGESWSLPNGTPSGAPISCHNVKDIPEITLTLTGANDADFGVEDLDSTLSINLVCGAESSPNSYTIASVKLDGNQTDVDGWTFKNPTLIADGIKFDSIVYTTPKEVIDVIKSHIGGGNTWKLTCELGGKSISTDKRYAYSDFSPEVIEGTALSVTNYYGADPNAPDVISDGTSSCVSGISYTSSETPTGIMVTPFQSVKNVDRIGHDSQLRGKITVTIDNDNKFEETIKGNNGDTNATVYPTSVEARTVYLGSDCAGKTYNVTQTMYGSDADTNAYTESKTGTIESSGGSSYKFEEDTYNTINLYTEDRGGDYNRVLAYIGDNNKLTIAKDVDKNDVPYDSAQTVVENTGDYADYYNRQAVVQNGKLIHPSKVNDKLGGTIPTSYTSDTTTPRYYVRKITRHESDDSQNSTAKLVIGECNGIDPLTSIWIASGTLPTLMMRQLSTLGAGAVNTDGSIDFSLASFTADPVTNSPFYIVIKLDGVSAQEYIQGPIVFSIGQ